jgi:probable HAF family extracellular repeat protein
LNLSGGISDHAFLSTIVNNGGGAARVMVNLDSLLTGADRDAWRRLQEAKGINNIGEVVGRGSRWTGSDTFETRGYYLKLNRTVDEQGQTQFGVTNLTDLGQLSPQRINDFGYIAGDYSPTPPTPGWYRAFVLSPEGAFQDLGYVDPSHDYATATAINLLGEAAGTSALNGSANWAAFRYTPGVGLLDLSKLRVKAFAPFQAFGINNDGDVVGMARNSTSTVQAFKYQDSNGKVTLLGTLGGDSEASSINDAGEIVGRSGNVPFLLVNGYPMTNLESLLVDLPAQLTGRIARFAPQINENGLIMGTLMPAPNARFEN